MPDSENQTSDVQLLGRFQQERHSLRLSASNISAIAGYHPWKEIQCLLMDLVYQGRLGQKLLAQDCENLSIEIISEEAALSALASRAGVSIQQALDVKRGKRSVNNIQEANDMKEAILKKAKLKNAAEMKELKEGVRNAIDTSYGTFNEDQALNEYEKITGWPVTDRNTEIMAWDFDSNGKAGKVRPLRKRQEELKEDSSTVERSITGHCAAAESMVMPSVLKSTVPLDVSGQTVETQETTDLPGESEKRKRPYFCILGSIDGIREELILRETTPSSCSDDDDDSFSTRKVIVECKHRMSKFKSSPPMYDQIQAVVYMLMYQVDQADIVQVLRSKAVNNSEKAVHNTNHSVKEKGVTTISLAVHRITLDDATHQHRFNWERIILPRLLRFVQAVYDIRSDDHLRYRLLTAVAQKSANDASKIIFDACPWFMTCETAFQRTES